MEDLAQIQEEIDQKFYDDPNISEEMKKRRRQERFMRDMAMAYIRSRCK